MLIASSHCLHQNKLSLREREREREREMTVDKKETMFASFRHLPMEARNEKIGLHTKTLFEAQTFPLYA